MIRAMEGRTVTPTDREQLRKALGWPEAAPVELVPRGPGEDRCFVRGTACEAHVSYAKYEAVRGWLGAWVDRVCIVDVGNREELTRAARMLSGQSTRLRSCGVRLRPAYAGGFPKRLFGVLARTHADELDLDLNHSFYEKRSASVVDALSLVVPAFQPRRLLSSRAAVRTLRVHVGQPYSPGPALTTAFVSAFQGMSSRLHGTCLHHVWIDIFYWDATVFVLALKEVPGVSDREGKLCFEWRRSASGSGHGGGRSSCAPPRPL